MSRGHNCRRCGHWIKENENGYFTAHKKGECIENLKEDIKELRDAVNELRDNKQDKTT